MATPPKVARKKQQKSCHDSTIVLNPNQEEALVQMEHIEQDHLKLTLTTGDGELVSETRIDYETGTLQLEMGTGKTFVVLEYIRRLISPGGPNWHFLVIIPHLLIGQWSREVHRFYTKEFTEKYCLVARTRLDLNSEIPKDKRIFFVNANLLKATGCEFHEQFKQYNYKTIFMDEEIYYKLLREPQTWDYYDNTKKRSIFTTEFVWLISATKTLAPRRTYNARALIDNLNVQMTMKSIVQNTSSSLDFVVEEYTRPFLSCHLKVNGLIDSLYDLLSLSGQKDYLRAKIFLLENDIEKRSRDVERCESEISQHPNIVKYITNLKSEADLLRARIESDRKLIILLKSKEADDSCPVCLEYYVGNGAKMFLPCCKGSVCNDCLRDLITHCDYKYKCPLCRNSDLEQLVTENKLLGGVGETVTREYMCFSVEFKKLLGELTGKSVIVYENNSSDSAMASDMVREEIQSHFSRPPLVIGGNNFSIEKTVRTFEFDPDENFLLLKSTFNYGLNLQFADNVVFLTFVNDTVAFKQILGRLLRLGRTKVLKKYFFKPSRT